jgi:hypothetical protein
MFHRRSLLNLRSGWAVAALTLPLAAITLATVGGATRTLARPGEETSPRAAAAPLIWTDIDGRGYGPVHLRTAAATVFIFVSTDCPVASAYAPRLRALEAEFQPRRVNFFLVNAHPTDTPEAARTWVAERNLGILTVKDSPGINLTDRFGVRRTTEAVVVGRDGQILYRGPIDDAKETERVRVRYLRDALESILAGRAVARTVVPLTEGCLIPRPAKTATRPTTGGSAVTYSRDVAPLLNRSCVPCHRDGQVAPFALDSYAPAKLWAPMIAESTRRKLMPPWKAAPGYGEFHGDMSLKESDIALLQRWNDQGAPAGDLKTAPKPPPMVKGWSAGTPDVEISMERPYRLTPDDKDNYRCFILPTEFREDAYVNLSQVQPGNPAVVHHIEIYVVPDARSLERVTKLDAADPDYGFDNPTPGGGLVGDAGYPIYTWVPGGTTMPLPDGVAYKIPKGAKIALEVHYHRSGRPETDRSTIGLTFARNKVQHVIHRGGVAPEQDKLVLPAGKARIPITATVPLPTDMTFYGVFPHMHRLGKEMHVWAEKPDGAKVEMVWVKDWDFNWQQTYRYKDPIRLPKGTKLRLEAVFDNSAMNPRNSHRPPREVRYGEATDEEMCYGFLYLSPGAQKLDVTPVPWREAVVMPPPAQAAQK